MSTTLLSDAAKSVEIRAGSNIEVTNDFLRSLIRLADAVHSVIPIDYIELKQQGPAGQYNMTMRTKDNRFFRQDLRQTDGMVEFQLSVMSWFPAAMVASYTPLRGFLTSAVFTQEVTYFKITYL